MNSQAAPAVVSNRLTSVDALRGFDMFWIVGGREFLVGLAMVFGSDVAKAVAVNFHHAWGQFHFWI